MKISIRYMLMLVALIGCALMVPRWIVQLDRWEKKREAARKQAKILNDRRVQIETKGEEWEKIGDETLDYEEWSKRHRERLRNRIADLRAELSNDARRNFDAHGGLEEGDGRHLAEVEKWHRHLQKQQFTQVRDRIVAKKDHIDLEDFRRRLSLPSDWDWELLEQQPVKFHLEKIEEAANEATHP